MVHKFDPAHAAKLENPDRLVEMPPARLIELLELTGVETVVDFGAGTGMYSLAFAEAVPHGELIAVDEQPILLDMLRAKLDGHHAGARVRIVVNDEGRVPLPDGAADRIVMINVLHHIAEDAAAMAEVARLLASGGLLLSAEFARMERPVGPPNDHVLALEEMRALLAGLGLEEREVRRPGELALYHNVVVVQKPAS